MKLEFQGVIFNPMIVINNSIRHHKLTNLSNFFCNLNGALTHVTYKILFNKKKYFLHYSITLTKLSRQICLVEMKRSLKASFCNFFINLMFSFFEPQLFSCCCKYNTTLS